MDKLRFIVGKQDSRGLWPVLDTHSKIGAIRGHRSDKIRAQGDADHLNQMVKKK